MNPIYKIEELYFGMKWRLKYNWVTRRLRTMMDMGEASVVWGVTPYDIVEIERKVGRYNIYSKWVYGDEGLMTVFFFDPFPEAEDADF